MKLLHVSDLHARRSWFRWVADYAEDYDLIACTGDFLDAFGAESLGTQVRWITAWARALPCAFVCCPGNQDVECAAAPVVSGHWMTALPGAKDFSQSGHLERLGHTFVRVDWLGVIPELRRDDIVLSHAGPFGCFTAASKEGGMDNGDLNLADALRSSSSSPPWLVLSGHIHNPARWKDRCGGTVTLNPGMNPDVRAKMPNFVTVDTAAKKAHWFRDGELVDVASL
jgi:Icc-related predicted phosphoesterase